MNAQNIQSAVVKGTLSSYLLVAGRVLGGLASFRLLFQEFSREEFGFWSLLWSVFGYGILLDFGFGYAAQKKVAELSVRRDWNKLSEVLSSIFFFYLAGAALLALMSWFAAEPLLSLFRVSEGHRETFQTALMIFFAGMGLALPLGVFPEVLRGQQRLAMANHLTLAGVGLNLVLLVFAVFLHWGFLAILVISLGCIILPEVACMVLALRRMPEVRISWRKFSTVQVLETGRFSVYAYLNTLSNLLRNKTDQLIISSVLSVSAVTPFQAGAKVGEMFHMMTRQISEALSPASAHLHASGQKDALRDMMIGGMRYGVMAALPLYIICAFYLEGLVRLLTGMAEVPSETWWVGQLLLFWYFSLVLTHLVFKRMFIMAGQEKRLMWQGVGEGMINVVLSLALTFWLKSIVGVALGSIVPTVLFGWGVLWRWAAHEAGLSYGALLTKVIGRAAVGCLPMTGLAFAFRFQTYWPGGSTTALLFLEGFVLVMVGLAGLWTFSLSETERQHIITRLHVQFRKPENFNAQPRSIS
jgi:O-antigen/teichoic acid export membrane protein